MKNRILQKAFVFLLVLYFLDYVETKIAEIDSKIKAKKSLLEGGSAILESDLPKELAER